jgi:hypothetical protein
MTSIQLGLHIHTQYTVRGPISDDKYFCGGDELMNIACVMWEYAYQGVTYLMKPEFWVDFASALQL